MAINSTFIPELIPDFFGDYQCSIIGVQHAFCDKQYVTHYHWGYRHWLYFFMCLSLFVIQIVSIINYINKEEE